MSEEKENKLTEKLNKTFFNKFFSNQNSETGGNTTNKNKKKIENLVVLVIILIITVIIINAIWNDDKKRNKDTTDKVLAQAEVKNEVVVSKNENIQNSNLEERLENILQSIDGVGKVKVLLTYSESSTTLAMYNEDITKSDTEETDTRGWK